MTRRGAFSAGHPGWVSALSEEENRQLFGEWASRYNHGHNYNLDVTVEGDIDPRTGMVVNIKIIDEILKGGLVAEFNNRSINDEIPWFHSRSTSLESLVEYI